ncbi:extracellular matrix protein 14 [Sporothrix schenckii 1099-18]|uniref:Inactive metallocarboxypeptidase ECM14 n=1 Tax=Sporothrix schenckii 1099-18 TaxID=1397361 RepID=A0A0F2LSF3_SPOSC|nr:extracellular matrix protein 14 [Sporothrix schenckii 1099-18]KJR80417.1 extracellular matrix protein 14 [Sporothrix schenckii 1099-18]
MWSRSLGLLLVPAIVLLLLISPSAAARHHVGRISEPAHGSWVPRFMRLAWLRDSIADYIFNRDRLSTGDPQRTQWYAAANSARYAQQTVIRFNVATPDEEAALAAAAQRLFLDIWSFNNFTGTVDILIDKEDVSSLLTLLPTSLHRSFSPLVPDLAAAVRDTYPKLSALAGGDGAAYFPPKSPGSFPNDETSVTGGGGTDNIFFRDYQPYPVIVQWMKLLDVMFPFVNTVSVGESAEGREILGLRVGTQDSGSEREPFDSHDVEEVENVDEGDEAEEVDDSEEDDGFVILKKKKHNKHKKGRGDKKNENHKNHKSKPSPPGAAEPPRKRKTILITGGLHAREWISSSSVSYIAWAIITGYGHTNMITKLVDNFDIVLVPVVNPDGYEYTWQTDRLWRKTRQTTNFRYCRGLDLDHAFGYEWDRKTRDEPCSESYGGESAFQAVEAQTLSAWARREVDDNNVEFSGFLDLHSYSQQIMFPFSYSCAADPPNLENLEELAAGLAKAIRLSTGETYSVSSACEGVMSFASDTPATTRIESGGGSAIDWFYHELHAKYSYQIKLRDTGSYGFLLPSSEIVPTGEEVFSAVKYFGDFLLGNNGIEKSYEHDADVTPETETEAKPVMEMPSSDTAAANKISKVDKMHITDDADLENEQFAILLSGRRRR